MRPARLRLILPLILFFHACDLDEHTNGTGERDSLEEIDARILADPSNAELFAERARFQEERDSLDAAVRDWGRAIQLDSTNATFRIALGDLYYRKVRWALAELELNEAIRLAPEATEARLKLAEIKLMTMEHSRAMELANEALRIDPQNAKGYFLKGWIHKETGDTVLAISSYRTAVERDPSFYDAYVQLGVLHAEKRDPLALDYYNSALEVRPRSVEAWYGKGMFSQENGMDSLAITCYDRMKEIDPRDPLPWYNTGYIFLEHEGRAASARKEFDRAIELLPTYAQAYSNRGLTFELEGMLDSALLDYQQALALDPDMLSAAHGLGRLEDKGFRLKR